jgi:hypothetical protein
LNTRIAIETPEAAEAASFDADRRPPTELLGRLAALGPAPQEPAHQRNDNARGVKALDLGQWLNQHHIDVARSSSWNAGWRWVLRQCPWNPDHQNLSAVIVQFPSGAIAAGCHHDGCVGKEWADLRELHEPGFKDRVAHQERRSAARLTKNAEPDETQDRGRLFMDERLNGKPKPIPWLWYGYLPRAAVVTFDAAPGDGKTSVLTDILARFSRGDAMPNGEDGVAAPEHVAYLTSEEPSDIIWARFLAARCNSDHVHIPRVIDVSGGRLKQFTLPDGIGALRSYLSDNHIRIAVLDQLDSFVSTRIDMAKSTQGAKQVMAMLSKLAENIDCTLFAVRHLGKGSADLRALYRGLGSVAIVGTARSGLAVEEHPSKTNTLIFRHLKKNYSEERPTLEYRTDKRPEDVIAHVE